jgi:DNA (cytosine-5)-methyltransferase 1
MIFGSVCSGIEAASVAWAPLGWRAAFLSEIDPQAWAVLAQHYPDVPTRGDFTEIQAGDHEPIDLLVGGTPCQSFSVAGLRGGLADARGNLALEFLRLADRLRPRWIVWENVPGVLSATSHNAPDPRPPTHDVAEGTEWVGEDEYDADEDHAFACFLAGLSDLGYGWSYRSLDAQYFGLAQRRERVFVVGYLGDWRRAAAVLFEPASLRGDSAPRRQAGQGVAAPIAAGSESSGGYRNDAETTDNLIVGALDASAGVADENDAKDSRLIAFGGNNTSGPIDVATALNASHTASGRQDFETETFIAHTLRAEGFDAGDDVAFSSKDYAADAGGQVAVALQSSQSGVRETDAHATLDANNGSRRHNGIATASAVRRLTPTECERLMGFPDNWTLVPWRGKPMADGPRYRMLGNSMAVPVVRWIGERIQAQESALKPPENALAGAGHDFKHVEE